MPSTRQPRGRMACIRVLLELVRISGDRGDVPWGPKDRTEAVRLRMVESPNPEEQKHVCPPQGQRAQRASGSLQDT